MRCNPVVRVFDDTRKRAINTPTWRLKMRTYWAQRQIKHHRTDANILRLIALEHVLRHRPVRSA
jgi:hypothetical protein